MSELNHMHMVFRAEIQFPPKDDEMGLFDEYLSELIDRIGMEVLLGPYTTYHYEIGNRGLTSISAIKTSHITAHVWDECNPAVLQLDVYSCKMFNVNEVVEWIHEHFGVIKGHYMLIDRNHDIIPFQLQNGVIPPSIDLQKELG